MSNLIQANEVTPYIRGRVIAILNGGFTPQNLRIVSSGVGFESYLKASGIPLSEGPLQIDAVIDDPTRKQELKKHVTENRKYFVKTALDIYLADLLEQFANALFDQTESVPDGTGNSTSGANEATGERCPHCGEVHD